MSYNTHNMHSTQIKNLRNDQGMIRCNQTWEYIKLRYTCPWN